MVLATSPNHWSVKHIALRICQVAVTMVALFWSWFAIAVAFSEGVKSLPYAAMFVVPLTALAFVVWKWPQVGGLLLIAAGIVEFICLPSTGARLWMATPSILAGITLLLVANCPNTA